MEAAEPVVLNKDGTINCEYSNNDEVVYYVVGIGMVVSGGTILVYQGYQELNTLGLFCGVEVQQDCICLKIPGVSLKATTNAG